MDSKQRLVDLNEQLKKLSKSYLETHEKLLSSKSALMPELNKTEVAIKDVLAEIEKLKKRHTSLEEDLSAIRSKLVKIDDDIKFADENYEIEKTHISSEIKKLEELEKSLEKNAERVIAEYVLKDMDLFMNTLDINMRPAPTIEESQIEVSISDYSGIDSYLKNTSKYTLVGYKKPDGKVVTRGIRSCPENFRLVKACLEIAGCVCKGTIADVIKKLDYKSEYDSEQLDKLVVYTKTDEGFKVVSSTSTVTDEDVDKVFTQMNNHKNNTSDVNLLYGSCAKLLMSGIKSNIKHLPSETVRNTLSNVSSELDDEDYKLILEVI